MLKRHAPRDTYRCYDKKTQAYRYQVYMYIIGNFLTSFHADTDHFIIGFHDYLTIKPT